MLQPGDTPSGDGTLAPGTLLDGRYRIVAPVKSGGMGAVYRATDERLADSVVAVKQMHDPSGLGEHAMIVERRFHEEMKVLTALRHPGIPRVLDFFRGGRNFCIIMDFVEGQNLEPPQGQTMSEADVLDVAEQVLEILVYLHGHSPPVVHRDVKPANLIELPSHGRIMLVDFGLARTIESSAAQTMVGTIGYAPIEQLQGRAEVRSDLYGLGATMHHLLAGALPPALCLPSLKQVRPDAHPAMVELVDKAVQTNPGDRFSDASSMLLAVREVRTQLPVRPEADPEPEPVKDGSPERILIVDDDSLVRNFVQRVLEREMYQVLVAHDGQEALQLALKTRPDLIVSDVQMPGMDGLALCRKLQSHRVTRHIPVLFLTGKTEVADETLGLEAGAEDYISKPIVPERLVARVQAALRRRMGREG